MTRYAMTRYTDRLPDGAVATLTVYGTRFTASYVPYGPDDMRAMVDTEWPIKLIEQWVRCVDDRTFHRGVWTDMVREWVQAHG